MSENRGQLLIGSVLIVFGLVYLLGTVFHIDMGALCWPTALILFGLWLLLRPALNLPGREANLQFFGGFRRSGSWQAQNEQWLMFVGDVDLDLNGVVLPPGETTLHILGFVGDVRIHMSPTQPVAITAGALITDSHLFGQKQDHFLAPFTYTTPGFQTAASRLRIETSFFIQNLKVDSF